MQDQRPALFEDGALARRRDRAMARGFAGGADVLWHAVADLVAERLDDVTRDLPRAITVGTGAGALSRALSGRAGEAGLVQVEPSPRMAEAAGRAAPQAEIRAMTGETLPLDRAEADLAVSALTMHWLNDPVGHLIQLREALSPDGLIIAALFGGQTLSELRAALATAEAEVAGGISPRVAPMGEIRDLGALLQRAGLSMPVADSVPFTLSYADPWALMRDLRAMGETNILADRLRRPTRRAVLTRAVEIYAATHAGPDGRVPATFEVVMLTGWAPGPDQPTPKRPGSARSRLADALGTVEMPAGDKAPRRE